MSLKPSWRAVLMAVIAGLVLHTITALSVWQSWGYLGRANVLTLMDLPVSLTFLHLDGAALLSSSLIAGGLQWAGIAALLTVWVGSTTHRRRTE
jgi:hypothetical protein